MYIQRSISILFLLSLLTGCQPALKEFQPEKDSLFKITFSYPVNWNWENDIPFDDLRPSDQPPPSERIIYKNEQVSIQVSMPSNPQAIMQEWMDSYLGAIGTMLRTDTTIQIDGYGARWLTVVSPSQNTSEPEVQEVIYLLTQDRFYVIDLTIPESEVDGRLHKQFTEFIKTIKILE
jgi:hypothetical protein